MPYINVSSPLFSDRRRWRDMDDMFRELLVAAGSEGLYRPIATPHFFPGRRWADVQIMANALGMDLQVRAPFYWPRIRWQQIDAALQVAYSAGLPPVLRFRSPNTTVRESDSGQTIISNVIDITRYGLLGDLTVNLSYGGTASSGIDYGVVPAQVVIPAGQNSVSFQIAVNGDTAVEPNETVIITARLAGYTTEAVRTITITNDDSGTAPLPALALTGALSYTTSSDPGTVIASIGNVPAGVTPTISPNDGRLVVAGSEGTGWRVAVGLTQAAVGSFSLTVSATGATSVQKTVQVTQGEVGEPSNLVAFRPMGSNLDSAALIDFGTGWPLLNHFKAARFTKNGYNALDPADLDAEGYPLIPVRALLGVEGQYRKTGMTTRYVYRTGQDTANLTWVHADVISDTPAGGGKPRTVVVDTANAILDGSYRIEVISDQPYTKANAPTFIREDQVALYDSGEKWNPDYIDEHKHYGHLRFMDYLQTNNSAQSTWASRPTLDFCTYNIAPIELCIELANKVGADMWYCVPHMATDDYVRRAARMIKAGLRADLRLHVEYSNERWNDGFGQSGWLNSRPLQVPGVSWQAWGFGGYRAAQVAAMFYDEWGDQGYRIRSHLGTQQPRLEVREDNIIGVNFAISRWSDPLNPDYNPTFAALFKQVADLFQFVAITSYVSGGLPTQAARATVEAWADLPRDQGVANAIRQLRFGDLFPTVDCLAVLSDPTKGNSYASYVAWAAQYGLGVSTYEGGNHVNPDIWIGTAREAQMTQFFIDITKGQEFADILKDLHDTAFAAGVTLTTHFQDIGRWTRNGSWGLRETLYSPPAARWAVITQYNDGVVPRPALNVILETTGQYIVGAEPITLVRVVGGVGLAQVSVDALPDGRALRKRRISGVLTAEGRVVTTVRVQDEAVPPNVKVVTLDQNVIAKPDGKRYFRLTVYGIVDQTLATQGGIPSLNGTDFLNGGAPISMSGWAASGDQYNATEGFANLLDSDDTTIWTGTPDKTNVVTIDTGVGNAVKPTSIRMVERPGLAGRHPVDFKWEWSDDNATWETLFSTKTATYTNGVFSAVMGYSGGSAATIAMTQLPTTRVYQRSTTTGGGQAKGRGAIPHAITLSAASPVYAQTRALDGTTVLQAPWLAVANAPTGESTQQIAGIDARAGAFFVDLATSANGPWQRGTRAVHMGRIIALSPSQSIAVSWLSRLNSDTATIASSGVTPGPNGLIRVTGVGSSDIATLPTTPVWAVPADGGAYTSAGAAKFLNDEVARTGVSCAIVGFARGAQPVHSFLPGGDNYAPWIAALDEAGGHEAEFGIIGHSNVGGALWRFRQGLRAGWTIMAAHNSYAGKVQRVFATIPNVYGPTPATDAIRAAGYYALKAHDPSGMYAQWYDMDEPDGIHPSQAGAVTMTGHVSLAFAGTDQTNGADALGAEADSRMPTLTGTASYGTVDGFTALTSGGLYTDTNLLDIGPEWELAVRFKYSGNIPQRGVLAMAGSYLALDPGGVLYAQLENQGSITGSAPATADVWHIAKLRSTSAGTTLTLDGAVIATTALVAVAHDGGTGINCYNAADSFNSVAVVDWVEITLAGFATRYELAGDGQPAAGLAGGGKRFFRLRAISHVTGPTYVETTDRASLSEVRFMDGSTEISRAGWTATGDQYSDGEGTQKLLDGDVSSVWTGAASQPSVVVFDTGVGSAIRPSAIQMEDRHETKERAPGEFYWDWSDDGVAWTQIYYQKVTGFYPNDVLTIAPSYPA